MNTTINPSPIHTIDYRTYRGLIESLLPTIPEIEKNGIQRTINSVYSILSRKFNAKGTLKERLLLSQDNSGVELPTCLFGDNIGFFGPHNPYTGMGKNDDEVRRILSEFFGVDFSKNRQTHKIDIDLSSKVQQVVPAILTNTPCKGRIIHVVKDAENDAPSDVSRKSRDTAIVEKSSATVLPTKIQSVLIHISNRVKGIQMMGVRKSIEDIKLGVSDLMVGPDGKVTFSANGNKKLLTVDSVVAEVLAGFIVDINSIKEE